MKSHDIPPHLPFVASVLVRPAMYTITGSLTEVFCFLHGFLMVRRTTQEIGGFGSRPIGSGMAFSPDYRHASDRSLQMAGT